VSHQLLKEHYPGFEPWYNEHFKVPLSLFEGDEPYHYTRLWAYAYNSSLLTLIRSWKYIVPSISQPISAGVLMWIAETLHKMGTFIPSFDREDEYEYQPKNERSLILESHVREVIRDWFPNADAIIESMRDRIIPLDYKDRPAAYQDLVGMQVVNDPYDIGGSLLRLDTNGDTDPGFDPESGVYDPWSELGV